MREDYLTGESESLNPQEKEFDKALRPLSFIDFSGQGKIIDALKQFSEVIKINPDHAPLRFDILVSRVNLLLNSVLRPRRACSNLV